MLYSRPHQARRVMVLMCLAPRNQYLIINMYMYAQSVIIINMYMYPLPKSYHYPHVLHNT